MNTACLARLGGLLPALFRALPLVMLALGCSSGSSDGRSSTGGASAGSSRAGTSASTTSGGDRGGTSQSARSGGEGGGSQGGNSSVGGRSAGLTATEGAGGTGGTARAGGTAGAGGSGKGGSSSVTSTGNATPDAGWDGTVDASSGPKDTAGGKETAGRPDAPVHDTSASPSGVFKPPFILGADITITVEDEYWGANYTDNGQVKSLEQILKDHGFNFIRIGTFVEPAASDGYAADKASKPEAFRDLAHTITLAKPPC